MIGNTLKSSLVQKELIFLRSCWEIPAAQHFEHSSIVTIAKTEIFSTKIMLRQILTKKMNINFILLSHNEMALFVLWGKSY